MDLNLGKLKTLFVQRPSKINVTSGFLNPEVGFKVALNTLTKEIKVTIIGARHLPGIYGLNRVQGYILKVKVFPGKSKFETDFRTESWPVYNKDFVFAAETSSQDARGQLNGRFLVITAYAILEQKEAHNGSTSASPTNKIDKFKLFYSNKVSKVMSTRSKSMDVKNNKVINNLTFEKRRTVGSITYILDSQNFTKFISENIKATEEQWQVLRDLNIGLSPTDRTKNENRKGEIEVSLLYNKSEDGETCSFILALTKMRCNMQTMQYHEQLNGSLYLKLRILNNGEIVHKGKTKPFSPSISHKFDTKSTHLKSEFNIINLENISFQFLLVCKDNSGHKDILGTIVLSSKSDSEYLTQWEKALEQPGTPITMWQALE